MRIRSNGTIRLLGASLVPVVVTAVPPTARLTKWRDSFTRPAATLPRDGQQASDMPAP